MGSNFKYQIGGCGCGCENCCLITDDCTGSEVQDYIDQYYRYNSTGGVIIINKTLTDRSISSDEIETSSTITINGITSDYGSMVRLTGVDSNLSGFRYVVVNTDKYKDSRVCYLQIITNSFELSTDAYDNNSRYALYGSKKITFSQSGTSFYPSSYCQFYYDTYKGFIAIDTDGASQSFGDTASCVCSNITKITDPIDPSTLITVEYYDRSGYRPVKRTREYVPVGVSYDVTAIYNISNKIQNPFKTQPLYSSYVDKRFFTEYPIYNFYESDPDNYSNDNPYSLLNGDYRILYEIPLASNTGMIGYIDSSSLGSTLKILPRLIRINNTNTFIANGYLTSSSNPWIDSSHSNIPSPEAEFNTTVLYDAFPTFFNISNNGIVSLNTENISTNYNVTTSYLYDSNSYNGITDTEAFDVIYNSLSSVSSTKIHFGVILAWYDSVLTGKNDAIISSSSRKCNGIQ